MTVPVEPPPVNPVPAITPSISPEPPPPPPPPSSIVCILLLNLVNSSFNVSLSPVLGFVVLSSSNFCAFLNNDIIILIIIKNNK